MTSLDILVVLLYFVVLVGIGFSSMKRIANEEDYLVAGRRLGYGLFIPAIAAVVLGGASTFGSSSLGYEHGISGMWLVVMIGLGLIGMGILFSKKLSEYHVYSVSELLGRRFGLSSRYISAAIMAVYDMMVSVTAMISMGVLFTTMFGWPHVIAICVGGAILVLYTTLGGMWAVTLTDVIQFWVMTVGLLLLVLPMGFFEVGGMEGLRAHLPADYFRMTHIGGKVIFSYFLLYFFGMMIGQDIWQRAFTARNKQTLRNGTVWGGIYCIGYGIAGAVIGMTAKVLFPHLQDPQQALPQLATEVLPPGWLGLVIAAVASAVMSTASGTLMASATIIANDLLPRGSSEKHQIRLTRVVTLLIGTTAVIISLAIQNIVVALNVAYALLTGSVFIPVIAALFWKRVTAQVTLASMLISAGVVITDLMIEGISSLNPILYGLLSCAVVMAAGTYFSTKKESATDHQQTM